MLEGAGGGIWGFDKFVFVFVFLRIFIFSFCFFFWQITGE